MIFYLWLIIGTFLFIVKLELSQSDNIVIVSDIFISPFSKDTHED